MTSEQLLLYPANTDSMHPTYDTSQYIGDTNQAITMTPIVNSRKRHYDLDQVSTTATRYSNQPRLQPHAKHSMPLTISNYVHENSQQLSMMNSSTLRMQPPTSLVPRRPLSVIIHEVCNYFDTYKDLHSFLKNHDVPTSKELMATNLTSTPEIPQQPTSLSKTTKESPSKNASFGTTILSNSKYLCGLSTKGPKNKDHFFILPTTKCTYAVIQPSIS